MCCQSGQPAMITPVFVLGPRQALGARAAAMSRPTAPRSLWSRRDELFRRRLLQRPSAPFRHRESSPARLTSKRRGAECRARRPFDRSRQHKRELSRRAFVRSSALFEELLNRTRRHVVIESSPFDTDESVDAAADRRHESPRALSASHERPQADFARSRSLRARGCQHSASPPGIIEFLETVTTESSLRLRVEDLLADPSAYSAQVAEWLGYASDNASVYQMLCPERSPFARHGPPNARYGNDPTLLWLAAPSRLASHHSGLWRRPAMCLARRGQTISCSICAFLATTDDSEVRLMWSRS